MVHYKVLGSVPVRSDVIPLLVVLILNSEPDSGARIARSRQRKFIDKAFDIVARREANLSPGLKRTIGRPRQPIQQATYYALLSISIVRYDNGG